MLKWNGTWKRTLEVNIILQMWTGLSSELHPVNQQAVQRVLFHWTTACFYFFKTVVPKLLAPGTSFVEDHFATDRAAGERWFQDDSSTWHVLCILFLLLLHQLHLRPSGSRSQRLGTPALENTQIWPHCRHLQTSHGGKQTPKRAVFSQWLNNGWFLLSSFCLHSLNFPPCYYYFPWWLRG